MSDHSLGSDTPLLMNTNQPLEGSAALPPSSNPDSDRGHVGVRDDEDTVSGSARNRELEPTRQSSTAANAEESLKYGANHVMMIYSPVTICMVLVVLSTNFLEFFRAPRSDEKGADYLIYTPFHTPGASAGTVVWQSVTNALIVMGVVAVMTVFLVLLYKFRCYKFIMGWLCLSALLIMFFFTALYLSAFITQFNIPLDLISFGIFVWNFGVVGMLATFWKAPLRLQQTFLIITSMLAALVFIKFLPEWTAWVLMAFLCIWDLLAVLTPCGPLRMLVELAQERDEPLFPALIYSSTVLYQVATVKGGGGGGGDSDGPESDGEELPAVTNATSDSGSLQVSQSSVRPGDSESDNIANEGHNSNDAASTIPAGSEVSGGGGGCRPSGGSSAPSTGRRARVSDSAVGNVQEDEEARRARPRRGSGAASDGGGDPPAAAGAADNEESGVKLGLGDFIFYSLLVGKANSYSDPHTTIACFIAILVGLGLTLLLLAIFKRALPALPVSITFALIFYFATRYVISPFLQSLSDNQVFI